jgi:hypothetical protein
VAPAPETAAAARMKTWHDKYAAYMAKLPATDDSAIRAAYCVAEDMCMEIAKERMEQMSAAQKTALLMCESMRCCDNTRRGDTVCADWCNMDSRGCWDYPVDEYLREKADNEDSRGLAKGLRRWLKINEKAEPTMFRMEPTTKALVKALRRMAKPGKFYHKYLEPIVSRQTEWWRKGPWMPSKVSMEWAPCLCQLGGEEKRCFCRFAGNNGEDDYSAVNMVCGDGIDYRAPK